MSKSLLLFVLLLVGVFSSTSCVTTATRDNGETLKLRGLGKAEWPDGAKIEGKPLFTFPKLEFDN